MFLIKVHNYIVRLMCVYVINFDILTFQYLFLNQNLFCLSLCSSWAPFCFYFVYIHFLVTIYFKQYSQCLQYKLLNMKRKCQYHKCILEILKLSLWIHNYSLYSNFCGFCGYRETMKFTFKCATNYIFLTSYMQTFTKPGNPLSSFPWCTKNGAEHHTNKWIHRIESRLKTGKVNSNLL